MYLGADPELFVERDGAIIPAAEAGLEDGKHDPSRRWSNGEIQLYRDGFVAEINFTRPWGCRGNMGNALCDGLHTFLKARPTLSFKSLPAVPVSVAVLKRLTPDAAAFGCSPSFNAWNGGAASYMEVDGQTHPWRYAGGHLWFSHWTEKWWAQHILESVKLLDLYVGAPLSYLFDRPEQYQRRALYGRAGEFRARLFENVYAGTPLQGLEYRTPGPEWLNHAAFFSLALGAGRFVLRNAESLWSDRGGWLEGEGAALLQKAINTGEGLGDIVSDLSLGPFYGAGTLARVRDHSALGEERFDFKLFETEEFHTGWRTVLGYLNISTPPGNDE
jgi:hypothetical protein